MRAWRTALCALAGAAAVWSFAPFGIWWLAPPALAVLFRLAEGDPDSNRARTVSDSPPPPPDSIRARTGRGALCGFGFGIGVFGAGVWWIFLCLHHYAGFSFESAAALSALFVLVLALFPAAAVGVGCAVPVHGRAARLAALAAAWNLAEWIRGFAFTGFPFLSVGYSQIPESPLAGFAPVGGVGASGLAVALTASALAFLSRPLSSAASSAATVLILFILLSGAAAGRMEWTRPTGKISVSLLQGNVAQDKKWGPEEVREAMENYLALARDSGADAPDEFPRLIVLPETALPLRMRDLPENYLRDLAQAAGPGGAVIAGMFRETETGDLQNAAVALGGDFAPVVYGKRRLVPYGEYLPFAEWLSPFLRANEIPFSELSPGDFAGPMVLPFGGAAVSICYEDSFGDEWRGQWAQSGILANLTNDAWYDDSAMLSQHLQMSQARALESGRWLARATNTGETALINPRGRAAKRAAARTETFLTAEAELRSGETPYGKNGDAPVAWAAALILILSALTGLIPKGR